MYERLYVWASLVPLHSNPLFLFSKTGCKDCYISPAQTVILGLLVQALHAVGIGWCMSVLSPEVTFHKQQRIDYYCNLSNFVSPKLELCWKALVNISIELYFIYIVSDYCIKYVHNDLISDFSIFGIQIGIFTNMIYKFITPEATRLSKFWKHHIYFSLVLNLYHIRSIYMYEDFRCCFYSALSQWPDMGGCYIASMLGYLSPHSL